ncbi:GNAT family N-acetyltransferase [Ideonella sp. BN130291]|uniref:GNAT family N-acetyltransferase n=1 Tax=Ideonella sp. BN130291 TaxID=3112940 RepID=UPI002E25C866|nr:GNAT family N-acetyltransferase [Ideonella sp. BN130291]
MLQISDDPQDVDLEVVHRFLSSQSTWALGIPRETVARALRHSLCFSARDHDGRFVGFARVVTDRATYAWLCDVFVLPEARGQGIARALMQAVEAHADLQGLRRFTLATSTAPGLYAQHGFAPLAKPQIWMERFDPDVYQLPPA